ncbi:MAG: hypothetical protein K8I27_03675 [Planctomycetes bacterium]|nr:hypothetical protein [Planctomycetota bacterium]
MYRSLLSVIAVAVFGACAVSAQLSGTYTINNAGGANYADIGLAFNALETQGISGPVIFEVYDDGGTYISNANYALGNCTGVSAINTITVRAANGETPIISGSGALSSFGSNAGTICVNQVSYVTFEGLHVTGGSSFGIHCYAGSAVTGFTVRRCYVYNCPGVGIFGYGNSGPLTNCTIENNFVVNCQCGGGFGTSYALGAIAFRRASTNCVVQHNTVVRNSGTVGGCIGLTGGATYNLAVCRYNVFVSVQAGIPCWRTDGSTDATAAGCNYNFYYFPSSTFHYNTAQYASFAAWQTSGRDVNGQNTNPMLVNTSTTTPDLHLQNGSPCIDAAVGSTLALDFDGQSRPNGAAPDIGGDEFVPTGPSIFVSPGSINLGQTGLNTPGNTMSYTVSGYLTSAQTDIAAPPGVQIKLSTDTVWGTAVTIPDLTTWGPYTMHVRLASSPTPATVTGNITHISVGSFSANVSVNGSVIPPTLSTSAASINLGSTPLGTASTPLSYTVSGAGMSAATSISPPQNVEISFSSGSGFIAFPNSLSIPAGTGFWGPTPIWARIMDTAPVGPVTGNISHVSTGATTLNVSITGTVTPPTITTSSPTLALGSTPVGFFSTPVSYTVSGSGMQVLTTVTAPPNVQVSLSQLSGFGPSVQILSTGQWGPTTIWARIMDTAPVGPITGNISHQSTGATTVNVAVSGTVVPPPDLVVSTNSLNLGSTPTGVAGTAASFTISGVATTSATSITPPASVELSINQVNWLAVVNIPSTGNWATTTIYARIMSTAPVGPVTGDIQCVTTGDTENITVTGSVTGTPSLVATPTTLNLGTTQLGTPGSEFSYQLVGTNLVASTQITAPAGCEITETSGLNYTPTITITTVPNFTVTIFVRLTGATAGPVSGTITHVTPPGGANVSISGSVTTSTNLVFTRNGPSATTSVDNDEQGLNNDGLVVLDFSVAAGSAAWTLTNITFSESGSADAQTDINFVAMYLDDGNGTWDGPTTDTLATAAAGASFTGPDGDYVAALATTAIPASSSRRFFLVVKLAGTASAAETVHVEVTAVTATSGGGGTTGGIPTIGALPALDINPAVLDVTFNGPAAFTTVNNNSQGPNGDGHVICDVSVAAQNDSWTITSLTFTASGSADEQADISFLALYRDTNTNGVWDGPTTDTLATAATGTSFNAPDGTYTATLTAPGGTIAMNGSARYFLVAKLSGSASSNENFRAALTGMAETSPTGGSVTGLPTLVSSALVIDIATLTVNAGAGNPADGFIEATATAFTHTLGQIALTASNDNFTISGITLTLGGNGDWVNNTTGLSVLLDDGNGIRDAGDTLQFTGVAPAGSVTCPFTTNLTVNDGTTANLWVEIDVAATAGGSPSESFSASIAAPADVASVTVGGQVLIGTLAPVSGTLHVITYSFVSFTPLTGGSSGGAAITITGTGFAAPVVVRIGGVVCTGTAVVNPGGTQITGLRVPAGGGVGLPITLDVNNLGPKTLPVTFNYLLTSGGGGGGGGGGGCASEGGTSALPLALLALLTVLVFRSRRKQSA